MMSLPNLFNKAGIIPVILFIIFVCVSTSLCVCMLADTLSSYPGNKNFAKSLDFSTACHISIGSRWAMFVETLFLISCGVQACAGIVETSQSLDGFLSSFLLGNTYAVQFVPEFKLIAWSPKECKGMDELIESSLESCTPFNDDGPLILSLGFLLTAVLFLPLGR